MNRSSVNTFLLWLGGGMLTAVFLSLALAVCSNRSWTFDGWLYYFSALFLAAGLLRLGWRFIRQEAPPAWLGRLTVAAFLFRLTLGALWFVVLPSAGYGTLAERNGYIMADAYNRDRTAWRVGKSNLPLSNLLTVRSYRKVDQYGGLLFLSSAYYRLFDGQTHHPLLMIVLTAAFSSLAVPFTWAVTKRAFANQAAPLAAWGMALYPEAVLLGSSQMREAFLIPLIALAVYGMICLMADHRPAGAVVVGSALLLTLPFSPPATGFLLAGLVVIGLIGAPAPFLRRKSVWLAVAAVAVLVMAGIWLSWRNYAPQGLNNPVSLAAWWFKISAGMQTRLSILDSGWMQKILSSLPAGLHFPFMTLYGILRPLLPAALIDSSGKVFWQIISIWRSLGWTVLLPFLAVAPLIAFQKPKENEIQSLRMARAFVIIVWASILIASMRAGADLWDNPRYRAMFSSLQIALAAWVWMQYRQRNNPWLKHAAISLVLMLIWFIPWYLRRYFSFPWFLPEFFPTLLAGLLSVLGYGIYQFIRRRSS